MSDISVGVVITLKIGDSSFELSREDALNVYTVLKAALGIPDTPVQQPDAVPFTYPWKYPMYPSTGAPYTPDIVYTASAVSASAPVAQQ